MDGAGGVMRETGKLVGEEQREDIWGEGLHLDPRKAWWAQIPQVEEERPSSWEDRAGGEAAGKRQVVWNDGPTV